MAFGRDAPRGLNAALTFAERRPFAEQAPVLRNALPLALEEIRDG